MCFVWDSKYAESLCALHPSQKVITHYNKIWCVDDKHRKSEVPDFRLEFGV